MRLNITRGTGQQVPPARRENGGGSTAPQGAIRPSPPCGAYGPTYQGGNWCHVTANGTRMFDTSLGYVKSGFMLVKSCVP
jgi:hypothetical protein